MPLGAEIRCRACQLRPRAETGIGKLAPCANHVTEIEQIRDYGLRVVFGNWSTLKNDAKFKSDRARQKLKWVAYIGGKRESRRLLGDVILRQQRHHQCTPISRCERHYDLDD
jgi:hypothetical protein